MSLYRRTQRDLCEQAEADRDREHPTCPTCGEPKGWPGGCPGHDEDAAARPTGRVVDLMVELKARIAGGGS